MTKADQKTIDANPGLTPVQLLEKGLSQKGYNELVEKQETTKPKEPIQPSTTTPTVKHTTIQPAQPQFRQHTPQSNTAILVEKSTGKRTPMSRKAAEDFARKYPNTHYAI